MSRAKTSTRSVPVPPDLVKLLEHHLDKYKVAKHGRIFTIRTGADPGRPVASSTYTRVWRQAREDVFGDETATSPLARVPYQLRHAAVSLWLNAGVPATQVAEWAGHSLHVLLKVYAARIDGEETAARMRIQAALDAAKTSPRIPHDE
jgi:integrase